MKIDYRPPFWLYFGEGPNRWGAPNPVADPPDTTGMASAYAYLAYTCPDTKTAIAKLRQIRAAVKGKGKAKPAKACLSGFSKYSGEPCTKGFDHQGHCGPQGT